MFECMRVSRPEICIPIFITVFVIGNLGIDLLTENPHFTIDSTL